MKFIVTHDLFGEVDVKLARETKEKIRKIALISVALPAVVAGTIWLSSNPQTEETPEDE